MTFYRLGDQAPAMSEPGRFWLAPGAHVIGDLIGIIAQKRSCLRPIKVWFVDAHAQ